jgi:hypothetical protein
VAVGGAYGRWGNPAVSIALDLHIWKMCFDECMDQLFEPVSGGAHKGAEKC